MFFPKPWHCADGRHHLLSLCPAAAAVVAVVCHRHWVVMWQISVWVTWNPCRGYRFRKGQQSPTRTRTHVTHTREPTWVCKPVPITNVDRAYSISCPWTTMPTTSMTQCLTTANLSQYLSSSTHERNNRRTCLPYVPPESYISGDTRVSTVWWCGYGLVTTRIFNKSTALVYIIPKVPKLWAYHTCQSLSTA
jgi:hypothetical protein